MKRSLRIMLSDSSVANVPPENEHQRWASIFYQALVHGDHLTAGEVVKEIASGPSRLETIISEIIVPALTKLGDEWCTGDVSIGQQKLATQIVLTQLERLRALYAVETQRPPFRVLVACPAGERHFIGARVFADLCLAQGWAVDFLGGDVPNGEILQMARWRKPQLIAVSLTMEAGLPVLHELAVQLTEMPTPPKLLVGGMATGGIDPQIVETGVVVRAQFITEGLASAGCVLRENRPKAVLKEYLQVLGRRVKNLRTKHGWTQEQLAEATKVTRVCIVAVEGGKQNLSMDIVVRLANALSVAPEHLLSGLGDSSNASDTGA